MQASGILIGKTETLSELHSTHMLDRDWWIRNKDMYVNCKKCDATFHHHNFRYGIWLMDSSIFCNECWDRMNPSEKTPLQALVYDPKSLHYDSDYK